MPSRRVDAAHIAPYLTHVISHHGQVTLVPPDSEGRVRQLKPKKTRGRQTQERNLRPEEDLKFNTGPRALRNLAGSRGTRRQGRQDQGRDESPGDEGYPDYPPPSFQEAISMFPASDPYLSVTPIINSQPMSPSYQPPHAVPPPPSSYPHGQTTPFNESSTAISQQLLQPFTVQTAVDGGESETSSLEIIDIESLPTQADEHLPAGRHLEENIRRDWITRRGVEFPLPPERQVRGRSKNRSRAILDSDSDDVSGDPHSVSPLNIPKRKNLSLSPLRTLFPYRPMAIQERPMSAHPSPSTSPYSSRSSVPFLSTTSLKMSMSTTSFASSVKRENFLSRKLLPFKGKERGREIIDDWEVVEPETSPSLTSAVESLDDSSPPRSRSFTYGMPIAPDHSIASPVDHAASSPHPLSLRDRKIPPVPPIKRPKGRAPPPPPPSVAPTSVPLGPVLTSVRTRNPPPVPLRRQTQVATSSPLGQDSWRPVSTIATLELNSTLQRAIATPLPSTPIDDYFVDSIPPSPIAMNIPPRNILLPGYHPAVTSVIARSIPNVENSRTSSNSSPTEPPSSENFADVSIPGTQFMQPTSPSEEFSPTGRRHYPGRPLPRPPGSPDALMDPVYGDNNETQADVSSQSPSPSFPEGLLIDLEDNSLDMLNLPRTGTNEAGNSLSPSYAASSTSSVDLLGSIAETPPLPPREFPGANEPSYPTRNSPVTRESPQPVQHRSGRAFTEITDLDVLVSRVGDEERRDGTNYEALLLLSEFMGPASPPRRSEPHSQGTSHNSTASTDGQVINPLTQNVPLLADIQVERRRKTKEGRVRVKLVLIDTPVDKCGICLTQFRSGASAQLGSLCRHAFHEKCLAKWLARSKTCPMCRVALHDQE